MDNHPESMQSHDYYDDEISITELMMKLWSKRGLIVFLPLVLAGLTLAGLLATKATTADSVSYYIELVGIEKDAYPNDSAFSPQDLLNPEVLSRLARDFGIETPTDIAEATRISYGTPLSEGIQAEFRAALAANSKANPEQIAAITDEYRERIRDAARRGLRIAVDYVALGIDKPIAIELAYALPKVWNEVYATRFNIFMNTGVAGLSMVQDTSSIATAVGAMEADLHLRAVAEGIELLSNDSRFRALRTQDGVTPADLAKKMTDFRNIYFEPIYASSFGSSDTLARVYRRDLTLRMKEVDVELAELDKRIDAITELQSSRVSSNASEPSGSSSQMQIESDALGQLVSLSRQASLSEYLQASFEQRLELVRERAALETRLEKMGTMGNSGDAMNSLLSEAFVGDAANRYDQIKQDYQDLLMTAQDIAASETPKLFRVLSTAASQQQLFTKRDLLFLVLAVVLGGMIAVIAALVWPTREQRHAH